MRLILYILQIRYDDNNDNDNDKNVDKLRKIIQGFLIKRFITDKLLDDFANEARKRRSK